MQITKITELEGFKDERLPLTLKRFGKDLHLSLRMVTAAEMETIRQIMPEAVPPKGDDGKFNRDDPEYIEAAVKVFSARRAAIACYMLGQSFFGSADVREQVIELKTNFTEEEIATIVNRGATFSEITEADMEAAKEALAPFGTTKPAGKRSRCGKSR